MAKKSKKPKKLVVLDPLATSMQLRSRDQSVFIEQIQGISRRARSLQEARGLITGLVVNFLQPAHTALDAELRAYLENAKNQAEE